MITAQHSGSVTTIVLSRPPVNAIDPTFVATFQQVLDDVAKATPTLIVVRSDQKCFCAGADLTLIRGFFDQPNGVDSMVAYVKTLHLLFDRIEAFPAVTLACIAGPALGGGLELALSCDLRIATRAAKLGLPEARVGMIPGAGGTQRLTRLCGPGVSSRLILGGEIVDGAEAERLGIVQWSAEEADFDAAIGRIAERIAGLSRQALVASKDCILASFDPAIDGYARELEKPLLLMKTEEARARVAQFFSSGSR
jgi:enoyl-CoA hydratase/carnithine racemase